MAIIGIIKVEVGQICPWGHNYPVCLYARWQHPLLSSFFFHWSAKILLPVPKIWYIFYPRGLWVKQKLLWISAKYGKKSSIFFNCQNSNLKNQLFGSQIWYLRVYAPQKQGFQKSLSIQSKFWKSDEIFFSLLKRVNSLHFLTLDLVLFNLIWSKSAFKVKKPASWKPYQSSQFKILKIGIINRVHAYIYQCHNQFRPNS